MELTNKIYNVRGVGIIIYAILCTFFLSCSNKVVFKQNQLIFKIVNAHLHSTDTLYVDIINYSNNKFFLPIDNYYKNFNPKLNPYYNSNFYPSIIINRAIPTIMDYSDDLVPVTHNSFETTSDVVLINAKSIVKIKIPFSNKEVLPNREFSYIDRGLTKDVYKIYLKYNINKNDVESTINPELLNLLYEKGYQCYDGTIMSNVVKLVVE